MRVGGATPAWISQVFTPPHSHLLLLFLTPEVIFCLTFPRELFMAVFGEKWRSGKATIGTSVCDSNGMNGNNPCCLRHCFFPHGSLRKERSKYPINGEHYSTHAPPPTSDSSKTFTKSALVLVQSPPHLLTGCLFATVIFLLFNLTSFHLSFFNFSSCIRVF